MARKLKKVSANSDLVIPTLNRIIPSIEVQKRIVCVRGMTAIIDADIAELYGIETKRVNEAVRNNPDKFPPDYMFELTSSELEDLRSKISTANPFLLPFPFFVFSYSSNSMLYLPNKEIQFQS